MSSPDDALLEDGRGKKQQSERTLLLLTCWKLRPIMELDRAGVWIAWVADKAGCGALISATTRHVSGSHNHPSPDIATACFDLLASLLVLNH